MQCLGGLRTSHASGKMYKVVMKKGTSEMDTVFFGLVKFGENIEIPIKNCVSNFMVIHCSIKDLFKKMS